MYRGGYVGTILRVNLTERVATKEPLPLEVARDFLGGAGFGVKYLFDEVKAGTDPLGPDNKLIWAPGPFTGTTIPCASRMAITARSPLTGAVGMALTGGFFPAELKLAGYDMIIVEGKAEKPTFLWIKDDNVQFRDASGLWGMHTSDTQWTLKDELKDQNIRIACIGPAGERLVKMGCIINERRAAGRKGLGAVMGAKNLKAIAVRGTGTVPIADEAKFKEARAFMRTKMRESPVLFSNFAKTGTPDVAELLMAMGILSAKNYSGTGVFTPMDGLGMKEQRARTVGRNPCFECPVGCSQLKLARGEYQGILAEGPELETVYSLGSGVGVDNLDAVIAADRMCDEMGIDTMSAGVTIAFAMELYERGIITKEMTGGLELNFGNHAAVIELLRRMCLREGWLGDLLADGTKAAAEKLGGDAPLYAMNIKGLELPAYDVRGAKAHGLNYATAYTGGDHNRGYAFQEIFSIPIPQAYDRFSYEGKAWLCKWNQDVRCVTCDCAPMCGFIMDMGVPAVALENTAQIMEGLTGLKYTTEEIQRVGERVNNLAKAFNMREGFTRADDTFPRRLMEEPIPDGPSKGERISQEDLDRMLDEYYALRGWDVATGAATRAKLEELGLGYAADELGL